MPRLSTVQSSGRSQRLAAPPASSAEDPLFVASAARALSVLQAFGGGGAALGNGELAQATGLPKSTVSRLTYTLARLGWLDLEAPTQRYRLGPTAVGLVGGFLGARGVRQAALPHMEALALGFGAPVALAERDGMDMVYLAYARGDAQVVVRRDVGSRVPLAASAAGRAWLAAAHPVEAQAIREQLAAAAGRGWRTVRASLDAAVADLQRLGFTRSYGDVQEQVNAVAVPLRSPVDGSLAVLNLAAPAALVPARRFDRELGPALAALVRTVAAELQAAQGRAA